MRLFTLIGRVVILLLIPLVLIACAQYYVNQVGLQQEYLPFLEDGKTTKKEVYSKLNVPFDVYQDGRIWTYTMLITESGSLVPSGAGRYDLVLVFDENNVLRKHSLLRFKP